MAAPSAGGWPEMQDFVRGLFQGRPDLSVLTHAIIREKYLIHVGKETLTKEEKEQLKQLVEEELLQMKVDDSPDGEEVCGSAKLGGQKRSRCTSDTSGDEVKSKQEQKKQRTGKDMEISSDEEDSGIDSKKIPLHTGSKRAGKSSSSSGQEDSGAEGHTDGSESDGLITKNKRRETPLGERNEKQKGRKQPKGLCGRRSRDRLVSESEETSEEQQSDLEEKVGEQSKSAKDQSTESENDSGQEFQKKKKFSKEQKQTAIKGENRKVGEQRRKNKLESDKESEPSKVGRTQREKRAEWSESEEEEKEGSHNKSEDKAERRARKSQEGTKSEDGSGSESEETPRGQKKMAHSKQKQKTISIVKLDSDSDNSEGKIQTKVATQKGKRRKSSEGKWSSKSESDSEAMRQPKQEGLKRTQKRSVSRKKLGEEGKKPGTHKPKRNVSSEDSESDSNKCEGLKQKKKGKWEASSSEGESQSEREEGEKDEGKCQKMTPNSDKRESGSEESDNRIQRNKMALRRKSNSTSGSDSGQQEERQEKRGMEKSQKANDTESVADSEDSGRELLRRKKYQGQQKKEIEKAKRRRSTKEESENESGKEEESSSSGDEDNPTSSKRQHQGKDKDHHSRKSEEHPSIRRLKRYIRECGVHRNYKKLFEGCRSRKAQVEILKRELENLGMKGIPSLAKCKALKQKREEAAEVASLDLSNIISTEGRPRRRNVWSLYSKPQEPPSSPEETPIHRPTTDWSRLRGVISSDGESS